MNVKQLQEDLKTALKSGDGKTAGVLRLLISSLHNREIEKRGRSSSDALTNDEVLAVLQSEAKKRKESIELFTKGNRADLVDQERAELAIIERYLPKQMTEQETRTAVAHILAVLPPGAAFGAAMKAAAAELKGKADNALVAKLIKEKLAL
jgi:uncharacterized protein YqeY